MSKFSIFNIGTGHNRNEKNNLLVRLFDDCPSHELNKYINDGPGSKDYLSMEGGKFKTGAKNVKSGGLMGNVQGWGIKEATERTMRELERADKRSRLTDVYICGHSRGAILSVRIAAKLWERYGNSIRVNLFLLDPVKTSVLGTDFYNREIHPNVDGLRILIAEDLMNSSLLISKGGFTSLTLKRRGGQPWKKAWRRQDLDTDKFLRIPGGHGTGSQVDGNPIGDLVYQLARSDLHSWHAPVGAGIWGPVEFCRCYFRIQMMNPVVQAKPTYWKNQRGHTGNLRRIVNDMGAPGGAVLRQTDDRARRYDAKGITNEFRGNRFIVNEHHFTLISGLYPRIAKAIADRWKNSSAIVRIDQQILDELRNFRGQFPQGYVLLGAVFPQLIAN